jgi:hypothetical protein
LAIPCDSCISLDRAGRAVFVRSGPGLTRAVFAGRSDCGWRRRSGPPRGPHAHRHVRAVHTDAGLRDWVVLPIGPIQIHVTSTEYSDSAHSRRARRYPTRVLHARFGAPCLPEILRSSAFGRVDRAFRREQPVWSTEPLAGVCNGLPKCHRKCHSPGRSGQSGSPTGDQSVWSLKR